MFIVKILSHLFWLSRGLKFVKMSQAQICRSINRGL